MNQYNADDYTFLGLCNYGKPLGVVDSMSYLIGLIDSPEHEVGNPRNAKGLLSCLFDVEEQQENAAELLKVQKVLLMKYYYPQTPCMLTKGWCPIGAVLGRGLKPVKLQREAKVRAAATGIWEPVSFKSEKSVADSRTVEDLFWAILRAHAKTNSDIMAKQPQNACALFWLQLEV